MNHVFFTRTAAVFRSPVFALSQICTCRRQFTSTSIHQGRKLPKREPRRLRQERFRAPPEVIKDIFGTQYDQTKASRAIYELHRRRITGSLIDRGVQLDDKDITSDQAVKVLQWLRQAYPVDEAASASWYAEREIEKHQINLSNQLLSKASRYGLIDAKKKNKKKKEPTLDIMEDSFIREKVAEYNKTRALRDEAKQKAAAEAEIRSQEKQAQYALEIAKQKDLLDEQREAKFKKWDTLAAEAQLPASEVLDETRTAYSRLAAPTVFAFTLILLFSLTFSPSTIIDLSSPTATFPAIANTQALQTCIALTAIHLVLYLAWRRPELMRTMNRYFMLSAGAPRAFSLLGSIFSHQYIYWHLTLNTSVLFLAGLPLHEEVGRINFLAIYLIAGLAGNWTTLVRQVLAKNFVHASCGASGALYGLVGAFFTVQQERVLTLPFGLGNYEYDSWYGVGAMVVGLVLERQRKNIDHLVHVGGFVAGVVMGWFLRYFRDKEEEEKEKGEVVSVAVQS